MKVATEVVAATVVGWAGMVVEVEGSLVGPVALKVAPGAMGVVMVAVVMDVAAVVVVVKEKVEEVEVGSHQSTPPAHQSTSCCSFRKSRRGMRCFYKIPHGTNISCPDCSVRRPCRC